MHLTQHEARLCAQLFECRGVPFLWHNAGDAGQFARAEHQPRLGVGIRGVHVLRELADLHGSNGQAACDLKRTVHRREVIGVVGVLKQAFKTEERY